MRTAQETALFIKSIAKSRGIAVSKMLNECHLDKNVIDNMKNGSMPLADKLAKIAQYLGVTSEYLLGLEDEA